MSSLGLGKTLFNSSACWFPESGDPDSIELVLTERLTRKKASGTWPEEALKALGDRVLSGAGIRVAENRDVNTPSAYEGFLDSQAPFYGYLEKRGMRHLTSRHNPALEFVPHHLCHATAALAVSPFEKAVILVADGAGTRAADFPPGHPERGFAPDPAAHEEVSIYLQDGGSLRCVAKEWQHFRQSERHPAHSFSDGIGMLYEKAAEYVFGCKRSAGKVMGLAAFGTAAPMALPSSFLESLDWSLAFRGRGKADWEASGRFARYADLSASVQGAFEERWFALARRIRERFPDYDRLVLTGGCALNCSANGKLARSGIFSEIYVPPFPGDECIGLGAAGFLHYRRAGAEWRRLPHEAQRAYFGPRASVPTDGAIDRAFAGFEISRPDSIVEFTAEALESGQVVAWFQGRSESGPRALGNRSILARPDRPGLKDYLNSRVKFRESFRPYGSSCLHEKAHEYFDVPPGFDNPFMSFAVPIRAEWRRRLAEVTHLDGTSRMQTVRRGQNPLFHELVSSFGRRTGLFCLLNTSLNVMGEPIAETVEDARRFLDATPVDGLAIGDLFVRRRR